MIFRRCLNLIVSPGIFIVSMTILFASNSGAAPLGKTQVQSARGTAETPPPHVSPPDVPPLAPDASIATIKVHDRFRIELVVAEPLIQDPVAIDFAVDGGLWVTEMPDYSRKVDAQFEPSGRIRYLADQDNDGQFETSTVFTEGLRFPTDVKIWRDGILVCDAPDIIYFRDTDNDGVADSRKIIFTGFATHNPHARVNGLRIGLDHWVYGSCGLFGGTIKSFDGKIYELGARDFRCNPDTGEIEAVTGTSQQGRVRDDRGNWFGCHNSDLIRHYPWSDRYGRRNPHVAPPVTTRSLGNNGTLFPIGNPNLFKLSGPPGKTTSACGLDIYRDIILGDDVYGNSFTCEPANQLIHRLHLNYSNETVSISANRPEEESDKEFLASTDPWFRPVQLRTGPDGALWVVDMYRYVIEHPRWIPDESKKELNLFAGSDRGRIYRVVPRVGPLRKPINYGELTAQQLVEQLDSPNGMVRDTVAQLLVWRNAVAVKPQLELLALTSGNPMVRLHALNLLDVLEIAEPTVVGKLLADSHPAVCEHAIRVAESWLTRHPEIVDQAKSATRRKLIELVSSLTSHANANVRMQLAFSLGEIDDRLATLSLAKLASRMAGTEAKIPGDEYVAAAVLSSIDENNVSQIVDDVFGLDTPLESLKIGDAGGLNSLIELIGTIGSARDIHRCLSWLLQAPVASELKFQLTASILDSIDRRKLEMAEQFSAADVDRFIQMVENAVSAAGSRTRPTREVAAAVRFLGRQPGKFTHSLYAANGSLSDVESLFASTFDAGRRPEVQVAIIQTIAKRGQPVGAGQLIEMWPKSSPTIRDEILASLLSRDSWLPTVLDAIDNRKLGRVDFQADRRNRLLKHSNQEIRERASVIFGTELVSSLAKVVQQRLPALEKLPNAENGRALYTKHCASCHRIGDEGHEVGPDLAALTHKSAHSVLISIVDPNRDVPQQYEEYKATMNDGRSHSGMLAEETSTSITLRQKEGKEFQLLRNQIDEMATTGVSVMPEGLEKELSHQELADLIAAVMELGNRPKKFAGNVPREMEPGADGSIDLPASTAEIYGKTIIFESESPFKNIGYWSGDQDFAVWRIGLKAGGKFDVWIEYACEDSTAGNSLKIENGKSRIDYTVAGTGNWENYRKSNLGALELPGGKSRLSISPSGAMTKPALLDLKRVLLVPAGKQPQW